MSRGSSLAEAATGPRRGTSCRRCSVFNRQFRSTRELRPMPHEPTPGASSARQLIESASAFARREMLAEAQQALQDARAALALRSDVGPAHWCDACLVALEIAARGGDVPELETEAAQLRSLSRGGRYWTEQARARVGGCAGRINPAHLDRVFAILAGEATPAAPHRDSPPIEGAYEAAAAPPVPARGPLTDPLLAEDHPTPDDSPIEAADVGWTARLSESANDLHSILVEDRRHAAGSVDVPLTSRTTPLLVAPAVEPAGLPLPEPLPTRHAARYGMLTLPLGLTPQSGSHAGSRCRLVARRIGPTAGGILVVLGLAAVICIYFFGAGLRVSSPRPGSAAEQGTRRGGATHVLGFASMRGTDPESAPRKHLIRGQALLSAGDTAGAVAALSAAAQSDSRGTIAWTAAETLARLPGRSAAAADAYLLAFAAGLPADRARTVAHAQELAGRPERARRVRQQVAGHSTVESNIRH